MADLVDLAQAQSERIDAARLNNCRLMAAGLEVEATGFCLNCAEPIDGRRWCDTDCRDQWEKRTRIMREIKIPIAGRKP